MKKYTNFKKNNEFSREINNLIPGGAHTYSKGDDQFPFLSPKGIKRGKGVYIWDIDDNKYLDWTMGLTSVCLGHAYEKVINAVKKQLDYGVNFQRPADIELTFAKLLKEVFPKYDMFKFAKNGSTVTTAAVKLSRAYTLREKVAVCKDQPFFSYDDWFIGSTKCDFGIPKSTKELTVKFSYNDIESVKQMFKENEGEIACLILEAVKFDQPKDNFLIELQNECKKNGTVFILDEMITGFRYALGGAQEYFGLEPDLSTFGKAVGNGFSVAFLAGKKDIMKLGGIEEGLKKVFLISTTHGAETHGLAAAIEVINELKDENIIEKNWEKGKYITTNANKIIEDLGLTKYIEIIGYPIFPAVIFKDYNLNVSMEFRTLFMQEMITRGVLFQGVFTIAHEHNYDDINLTLKVFKESCEVYLKAINNKSTEGLLIGKATKPVFREIN
ncbi:glutamate-1-semialdehyde 2,1-aminomutase [Helicovermis profundi]|uniref:Glutamate-1-semialdehyde 2,1-aminomutase n=1 Tax=Helicovermis profundi TaxID=3065157 RepID=A0AAU9ES22_9FIRM|nr:glutamate-1-semialdehyde 2,1-aminomutase [Clostridia bacterium S502]